MKFINSAIFLIAILIFSVFPTFAQENEPQVIDEVVAQVNDGVITLSRVKRENKFAIEALVAQGKSQEEAKTLADSKQGELIANLINEELILQKGKEIGADGEAEAMINQRFLEIMKEQKIKSLEVLKNEMLKQGLNPDELSDRWRKEFIREIVMRREVVGKIYYGLSSKEIREYFNANKDKFKKPETVTLSEIFLSFAGKNENLVRGKAAEIVKEIRSGGDFEKILLANSERPDIQQNKGKIGEFTMDDLKKFGDDLVNAIKKTKVGDVTEPIVLDDGIEIFKVEQRENPSNEGVFDEENIRRTIAFSRAGDETKKFMIELRKEAYIKITENYRAIVNPVLFEDERKVETTKKPAKGEK
ncbi:MAG: peptidyl-prolyl cis-trans isomerase [Pyrinomonadaceae bacterium]|jgi:parvulin-like peptidyl-prolyl isomerase|nr:peptidyl-prolyl cis-trans isomerase [Pyrinomonadaceae bacterium]